jgi:acetolactate synthase small subunit
MRRRRHLHRIKNIKHKKLNPETVERILNVRKVMDVLESGYCTATHIGKISGLEGAEIQDILQKTNNFRKSFIKSYEGEAVYMLNSRTAFIKDFLNAIMHIKIKIYWGSK